MTAAGRDVTSRVVLNRIALNRAPITRIALDRAPITRNGARDDARRELSRGIYAAQRPGPLRRLITWIGDELTRLWDRIPAPAGGHGLGLLGIVLLVAAAVLVIRFWLGPVRRGGRSDDADVFGPTTRTARQLRAEAESLAGRGAWAEAIRARMRAAVRSMEERGLSEPRPGRTLGEVGRDVATYAPGAAKSFARATDVFGDVWYGGRPAGPEDYRTVAG
ncbi:MAG: DUF4129 domain-containing protein, partial [Frankia sp.]